jgi:hypothetical protein
MSLWQRIRRFWASPPPPDHPLTEEERKQQLGSAYDELAKKADEHLGAEDLGDNEAPRD